MRGRASRCRFFRRCARRLLENARWKYTEIQQAVAFAERCAEGHIEGHGADRGRGREDGAKRDFRSARGPPARRPADRIAGSLGRPASSKGRAPVKINGKTIAELARSMTHHMSYHAVQRRARRRYSAGTA